MNRYWLHLTFIILFLSGCHARVSEKKAAEYRNNLGLWQEQMSAVNHQSAEKSAPYIQLEAHLRHEMGASRYEQQLLSPIFGRQKRAFEAVLSAWIKDFRQNSSEVEMFLAGTDEWLRNLPASRISRTTAGDLWEERIKAQHQLETQQAALVHRFSAEVEVGFTALISGSAAIPAEILPPVPTANILSNPSGQPAFSPPVSPSPLPVPAPASQPLDSLHGG